MTTLYTNGVTVTFNGAGGPNQITRITVNRNSSNSNRQRISTAHLGTLITQQQGTTILRFEEPYIPIWQPADGGGPNSVDIDYFGATLFTAGQTGALVITGPFAINATAATVASSSVNAAVGDLVRGSVSISFSNS